MERVGGDLEFLQEIAGLALSDCPKLLGQIRSALSAGDATGVEKAAHTLKGCVSNFGARSAREAALQLEKIGRAGELQRAGEACTALEVEMQRFEQALMALAREVGQ